MQSQKMQSQGYFEFRLCPHNTRRRPAQQVNGNIFQRDGECFEGKILTFSGKPASTEKISFFNTFFGRPASTSICWGERGEVFVSFLCLRNKLEAGRILIWSIIFSCILSHLVGDDEPAMPCQGTGCGIAFLKEFLVLFVFCNGDTGLETRGAGSRHTLSK